MKLIIMLALVLCVGVSHALPVTTNLDQSSVSLAQLILETAEVVQEAFNEAGIPTQSKLYSGKVTRFGKPGDYMDQYDFELSKCGPTPTSPCHREG